MVRLANFNFAIPHVRWFSGIPLIKEPFTLYQATFHPPMGNEPVVLDLQGIRKGMAWVNGNNIEQFWLSDIPFDKFMQCDQRGEFDTKRACKTICGEPAQRWFQTFGIGTICAIVYEGKTLTLTCLGKTISKIEFVSFGNPQGTYQAFVKGSEAPGTLAKVQEECTRSEQSRLWRLRACLLHAHRAEMSSRGFQCRQSVISWIG